MLLLRPLAQLSRLHICVSCFFLIDGTVLPTTGPHPDAGAATFVDLLPVPVLPETAATGSEAPGQEPFDVQEDDAGAGGVSSSESSSDSEGGGDISEDADAEEAERVPPQERARKTTKRKSQAPKKPFV